MSTTTVRSDADLLAGARTGDADALRALVERHLHPAWRIATVAAGDHERAEAATVDGILAGLVAAERQPELAVAGPGLRVRLVGATRQAATAGASGRGGAGTADDPVLTAFLALPEKSRTALWLTEVEGGSPEQVAPVLGLDRSAAAALADRAALALRERLATDVAARAPSEDCRNALAKLPAHAAGKLTAAERAKVGDHVGGCGTCAVWLAALVSPRPALRRLVADPPVAALVPEIEARWLEHLQREQGGGWLGSISERAVGAAAAAVLAIGLGGIAFLGNGDDDGDQDRRSEVALPASVDPDPDAATTPPTTPPGSSPSAAAPTTGPATASGTRAGGGADAGAAPSTRARSTDEQPTTPPTATPPPGGDPAPVPPPPAPPPPPGDDSGTQLAVSLLDGAVALGIGDCTGLAVGDLEVGCVPPSSAAPLSITIDLPGLDPIGI